MIMPRVDEMIKRIELKAHLTTIQEIIDYCHQAGHYEVKSALEEYLEDGKWKGTKWDSEVEER